jgi:leucyl-tRNA synthetase
MRFADPHNDKEFASPEALKQFLPVDVYMGGAEHTVLHLLYSRFITKVLYDYGYVTFDEPFLKLRHQGIILAEDHRKMSKRWGNVINPDDEIKKYGADTVRMYEMFMGPLKDMKAWDTKGVQGVYRFINRVITASDKVSEKSVNVDEQQKAFHKTAHYVGQAIQNFQFNTCISSFMELLNELQKYETIDCVVWEGYLKIMAPFAPFTTEKLWKKLGNTTSIHEQKWPEVNSALLQESTREIPVLVNGKVRGTITLGLEDNQEKAMEAAQKNEGIAKYLTAKKIQKVVYVKGKILNVLTA